MAMFLQIFLKVLFLPIQNLTENEKTITSVVFDIFEHRTNVEVVELILFNSTVTSVPFVF